MADDYRCFNCGAPTEVVTQAYGPICETCADARGVPVHEPKEEEPEPRSSKAKGGRRGETG